MEHAEVQTWLELAALQPNGLIAVDSRRSDSDEVRERASDGDASLHAVLEHLSACAACRAERDAWLLTVEALLRTPPEPPQGLRDLPSDALRDRTLAFVRAVGVPRGIAVPGPTPGATSSIASATPHAESGPNAPLRRFTRPWLFRDRQGGRPLLTRRLVTVAAAAAMVVLLLGAGAVTRDALHQSDVARAQTQDIARVTAALDAILRDPQRQVVSLARPDGTPGGTAVWSARSGQLVVLSAGLSSPQGGSYHCWVEWAGTRSAGWTMQYADGIAYWTGSTADWGPILPGSTVGVSLVSASDRTSQTVLTGTN